MSDEFRSLIAEAERLALPLGESPLGKEEGPDRWHEKIAETFPITVTGALRDAHIVDKGRSTRVEFIGRSPPTSLAAMAQRYVRGGDWNPERVSEAVRVARTLLVRSLASNALMWVSHIASIRARGHLKPADRLASRAPVGLRTDDWSDADAVCAAPWRYVGWDELTGAADCLTDSSCRLSSDLKGFSITDMCQAIALSWTCEAAASGSHDDVVALLVEVAMATGSGHFHAGWESGLDFALHDTPEEIVQRVRSASARNAANAAHRENRAMRTTVHQWCDENMNLYRSMDAAAEAIAGKLVPATFRTVRSWIGDWRREQKEQSARRP